MGDMREIYPRLVGLSAAFLAGGWLERLFPDAPDDVDAAGRGFPREIVTRMNQEFGDLADTARRSPEVARALREGRPLDEVMGADGGEAFRETLDAYLEKFGHRATGEIDVSNPRWREDPSSLLQVVRANRAGAEAGAHREHLEDLVREGEAAARRLVDRAGHGPLGFVKRPVVRRLVRTHRGYLPLREMPKQGGAHFLAALRESLLDAGELDRAGSSGLVDGVLPGTGVSSGVATGPARVVRDPAASSVRPGEILVAPSCGPGWTPLYLDAAALVSEVGGRISHGALVAREYGLPAVVSVRGATREIRTGQRLRVDGSRGVVEVLDESEAVPPG